MCRSQSRDLDGSGLRREFECLTRFRRKPGVVEKVPQHRVCVSATKSIHSLFHLPNISLRFSTIASSDGAAPR